MTRPTALIVAIACVLAMVGCAEPEDTKEYELGYQRGYECGQMNERGKQAARALDLLSMEVMLRGAESRGALVVRSADYERRLAEAKSVVWAGYMTFGDSIAPKYDSISPATTYYYHSCPAGEPCAQGHR